MAIDEFTTRNVVTSNITTDGNGLYDCMLSPKGFAKRVISDVKRTGDDAIKLISKHLDGSNLDVIEVPQEAVKSIANSSVVAVEVRSAIDHAAERIERFQKAAKPASWADSNSGFGEIVAPVNSVGAYVPGGSALLVSTLLMSVIPARVAGVKNVYVSTPVRRDQLPHPALLYAAHISGVDRVFKVGGAQAIAAFAYGTQTFPKVDIVCGPGNVFVTAAKKQVVGDVGIDGLNGPTETCVVADEFAKPSWVAADLIAQAEHDTLASPLLVTFSNLFADAVEHAITRQLVNLPRRSIAEKAINTHGRIVIVNSIKEAMRVVEAFAPEHLSLHLHNSITDTAQWANSVGGLFLGEHSPEVIGDYVGGPSHIMPTGRTARFASALSVRTFLRFVPFVALGASEFKQLADTATQLAELEQLNGHALSTQIRLHNNNE